MGVTFGVLAATISGISGAFSVSSGACLSSFGYPGAPPGDNFRAPGAPPGDNFGPGRLHLKTL